MIFKSLPGSGDISGYEVHLTRLAEELGQDVIQKVWTLYQRTGLIYQDQSITKLWGDRTEGVYTGPVAHMLVVACLQMAVAKALNFNKTKVKLLGVAGLIHDAFKRIEVESKSSSRPHEEEMWLLATFGEKASELAQLSGHTSMPKVLLNIGETAEAVSFLVDNMVVGTKVQPIAQKMEYLNRVADARYPYNNDGIALYGVPYFTFQWYLAGALEAWVAMRLGIIPTDTLCEHFNTLLNSWLEN